MSYDTSKDFNSWIWQNFYRKQKIFRLPKFDTTYASQRGSTEMSLFIHCKIYDKINNYTPIIIGNENFHK